MSNQTNTGNGDQNKEKGSEKISEKISIDKIRDFVEIDQGNVSYLINLDNITHLEMVKASNTLTIHLATEKTNQPSEIVFENIGLSIYESIKQMLHLEEVDVKYHI